MCSRFIARQHCPRVSVVRAQYFHFLWSALFEVGAVVLFLLLEIGVSGLAAVGTVFLLIPAQVLFVKLISVRQRAAVTRTVRARLTGLPVLGSACHHVRGAARGRGMCESRR